MKKKKSDVGYNYGDVNRVGKKPSQLAIKNEDHVKHPQLKQTMFNPALTGNPFKPIQS